MNEISLPYYKTLDVTLILGASIFAYWLRFGEPILPLEYLVPAAVLAIISTFTLGMTQFYSPATPHLSSSRILASIGGLILSGMLTASCLYLTKSGEVYSRIWFMSTVILSIIFITFSRPALRKLFNVTLGEHNIVLLGANKTARRIASKLEKNSQNDVQLIKHIAANEGANSNLASLNEIVQWVEDRREKFPDKKPISEIWITADVFSNVSIADIEIILSQTSAAIVYVPEMPTLEELDVAHLEHVAGFPTLNSGFHKTRKLNGFLKFFEDKVAAVLLLLLLFPILLLIAVLIKLDSKGPVLYLQQRQGFAGNKFKIFKFRTMSVCESTEEFKQATKDDQRITRIGSWLRKTSLDELPQLINVLNGTMSLVGPRPHPIMLNQEYRDSINNYMARHAVKPGITGLAQINGFRGETTEPGMMEGRIRCDLEYVKSWSIMLDLKIIFMTLVHLAATDRAY